MLSILKNIFGGNGNWLLVGYECKGLMKNWVVSNYRKSTLNRIIVTLKHCQYPMSQCVDIAISFTTSTNS